MPETTAPLTNLTLYKEGTGTGYNDMEMYISHTFGDPHIFPAVGEAFELPMKEGNYRVLQGINLVVNVSTRKLTEKEKSEMIKEYSITGLKNINRLITNGTYYDKLYIKSDGETFEYDFETEVVYFNDSKDYFRIIHTDNMRTIEFVNEFHEKIHLNIMKYNSPQMKHGIGLIAKKSRNLRGPMIQECKLEHMVLDNIYQTNKCKIELGKNKRLSKLINL
jgi:hypothetical protein